MSLNSFRLDVFYLQKFVTKTCNPNRRAVQGTKNEENKSWTTAEPGKQSDPLSTQRLMSAVHINMLVFGRTCRGGGCCATCQTAKQTNKQRLGMFGNHLFVCLLKAAAEETGVQMFVT